MTEAIRVMCLDDDCSTMVYATSRKFDTYGAAMKYADTIAKTRKPVVVTGDNWEDYSPIKALADECYPMVYRAGEDATPEQKTTLFRKWKQDDQGMSWWHFFHAAQPTVGCDGALVVQWCNMYLCIERDGYCHS